MNYRAVNFRGDGSYFISDDPENILYTFISGSVGDIIQKRVKDSSGFMKRFDPMGEGYYIYALGGASRTIYAPQPNDPEPQAEDEWTVDTEGPYRSISISGDELRHLFRQVITGLLPRHPELTAVYDT
ncbi:hypothetical protein [Deinococcus arcticus]|uniref:hypothetical protein n=1 Tax=Deinococcus arcticus TaxID=2136176 RepID=UPI0011B1E96D|nr:hypothetical protein [Deinococcus arcticus]